MAGNRKAPTQENDLRTKKNQNSIEHHETKIITSRNMYLFYNNAAF